LPRNSAYFDSNMHPPYADMPGKPNYEMYYPNEGQYVQPRAGGGGSRGPPRGPAPESLMRLPWAVWMGSNAKNRTYHPLPLPIFDNVDGRTFH
jgi:aquaporin related protein